MIVITKSNTVDLQKQNKHDKFCDNRIFASRMNLVP